jgi:signal peptidase I
MEPTLPVGRHLFADKLSLRLRFLRRGDIVILRSPLGDGEDLVKRVIALAGEAVELREKKVFINGRELEEPYAQHKRALERLDGDSIGPLIVPEGKIFVLGDNRDESRDSSVWKNASGERIYFIPIEDVVGLVRGIY